MRRLLPLLVLVLVAAGCGGRSGRTLEGGGVSLSLPAGWHGVAAAGQLQAADFPLAPGISPQLVRAGHGHVHLIVWEYGPAVPYLTNFPTSRTPLALRRRDITAGSLEGFPAGHVFAVRSVTVGGEMLQIMADLGPEPLAAASLPKLNRVLITLRVQPARVIRPRAGKLASDGLALRLLPGWSGRIEIPSDAHAAQLVLHARRGDVHIELLAISGGQDHRAELPITVKKDDILRHPPLLIARRVFSTAGRSIDLSVTVSSPVELAQANRLLATLTIAPRPWLFHGCDLSLRLPGTWRAALVPRAGCYPLISLRRRAVRVVLSELRPGDPASGRIVRSAGRRFRVEVTPYSANAEASLVLATLHADRRR